MNYQAEGTQKNIVARKGERKEMQCFYLTPSLVIIEL
jgi:hypothetical protein